MTAIPFGNGRRPDTGAAYLHRSSKQQPVDLEGAERAARSLLFALGADLDSPGLRNTPRRMAAAYGELLTPEPFSFTSFPNEEGYDELRLPGARYGVLGVCVGSGQGVALVLANVA